MIQSLLILIALIGAITAPGLIAQFIAERRAKRPIALPYTPKGTPELWN